MLFCSVLNEGKFPFEKEVKINDFEDINQVFEVAKICEFPQKGQGPIENGYCPFFISATAYTL
nr:hypothetical protein [Heyndrickxia oleronia]